MTAEITPTTSAAPVSVSVRRLRSLAVGAAVLTAPALWAIARAAGADLVVPQGDGKDSMTVGPAAVIATALGVSLLGWGALAQLERRTTPSRALRVWTWTAVTVLLLSLLPVLTSEAGAAAKTVLPALHLAVAAVLIPLMRRSASADGTTTSALVR
ncbi:DUF6069 family protein [Streptomyces sp. NPDC050738]|uniref:DUF6069 family protein n=1 Tax=Streptomyces sp. NPDC050738 TaxID=3154744 RepID=UPI003429BABD